MLIRKGAQMDCPNLNGETPLHLAVSRKFKDCARLLIHHGCDVHLQVKALISTALFSKLRNFESRRIGWATLRFIMLFWLASILKSSNFWYIIQLNVYITLFIILYFSIGDAIVEEEFVWIDPRG